MANMEYLICSFCQGPSSRSLRQKLSPHLSNPTCRIRPSDLDWLDNWRLLLPSHVEWDLPRLHDVDFENEYEKELPKRNVVSKVQWVPSIEGRISESPEWDDLDGWRTIEFISRTKVERPVVRGEFEHLLLDESLSAEDVISKRTLHAYNDDIEATRLPFHSACLRILYESCNEVTYRACATSTISDIVATILLRSWNEGDVSMDWLSRQKGENGKPRLITPWGEHWHPLNPAINFLAVDPSRPHQLHNVQSILIKRPQRTVFPATHILSPLLRMPAEVLDLISNFLMEVDTSTPRPFDPQKVQSLQNLRHTCRQLYHHSFPRIHFLSFLHFECRPNRPQELLPSFHLMNPQFQYHILIPTTPRAYVKPLLPYRRIPALPPFSATDRTVMETDWESMYRSWKEGLGWRNRVRMFVCCETWLVDLQGAIWVDRELGRNLNYVVNMRPQEQENIPPVVHQGNENVAMNVVAGPAGVGEDEEMMEIAVNGIPGGLEQFQWP